MDRPAAWTGSAFGLGLAGFEVPGLERSGTAGLRPIALDLATAAELRAAWGPGAETLVVRRYPDGRPAMLIDHLEGSGYRIGAPGYGRHLVSPDGSRVRSALPPASIRWQRLFVAQVLPLAA